MFLITLALAYVIARALSPQPAGQAAAPAPGKKPSELAAKWKNAPALDESALNRVGEFTAAKAAFVTKHALVFGKTFTEGWKASWREAWDVVWEPNDPDPPEDPDEPDDEPEEPDPDPEPTPPKPDPNAAKAPPAEPEPEPEPEKTGLEPGAFPYDPRRERPVRLVKAVPDPPAASPAPTPAAPSGRTSTMAAEVTGYDDLLQHLLNHCVEAVNDLEIAQGDAESAKKAAGNLDQIAAQIANANFDAETVAEFRGLMEATVLYATEQEGTARAAERRHATARLAYDNIKRRYQTYMEAAAAAPAVPDAEFVRAR